jgi:hypothetical protein
MFFIQKDSQSFLFHERIHTFFWHSLSIDRAISHLIRTRLLRILTNATGLRLHSTGIKSKMQSSTRKRSKIASKLFHTSHHSTFSSEEIGMVFKNFFQFLSFDILSVFSFTFQQRLKVESCRSLHSPNSTVLQSQITKARRIFPVKAVWRALI